MTLQKRIYLSLAGILLLAGGAFAASEMVDQKEKNTSPKIASENPSVDLIEVGKFQQKKARLSSIGEVEAIKEVKIRSQLQGNVKRVNVEIGDKVEKDELLVELEHSGLESQLAQNKASIAKLRNEIDKMKAGATKEQVKKASSSVEQAKAALSQAKERLEQTKVNNNSMIENAQIGVDIAKSNLSNQTTSTKQQLSNAYDNLRLASSNLLSTARTALTTSGNILGMKPGDKRANDAYEHLLGAQNSQAKRNAENNFTEAKRSYNKAKEYYDSLSSQVSLQQGRELDDLVGKSLKDMDKALDNVRTTLENTITSQSLSRESLQGLKQQIDTQISYVDQARKTLQTQRQAVENAKLSVDSTEEQTRLNYQKALQDLENAKKKAQSNLETARSSVEAQKKALAQARASYQQVTADPREVDLAPMRSSIEQLQAAQQGIRDKIEKAFIRAPFAGEVGSVPVGNNELVNPGDIVVSLVNKSGLQVRSYVSPQDKKYIQPGASALISDKDIKGTVSHVSPQVDSKTRKVEVITKVGEKKSGLITGEYVEVKFDVSSQIKEEGAYFLPFKAVKVTPEAAYVFTVNKDNRVEKKEVQLGGVVNEYNKVTQGLSPGMKIVDSVRGLEEGEKVKIE